MGVVRVWCKTCAEFVDVQDGNATRIDEMYLYCNGCENIIAIVEV